MPEQGLEAGDIGAVVHVYPNHEAYEVEFVTLTEATAAVVTVQAVQIRAVGSGEIPHARARGRPNQNFNIPIGLR